MTLYRSDCLWHVRGNVIVQWSVWSFEPCPAANLDRTGDRRFVRCDPFPVRIQTAGPAKIVDGRLTHAGDPWERWGPEMCWILASQGKRGFRVHYSRQAGPARSGSLLSHGQSVAALPGRRYSTTRTSASTSNDPHRTKETAPCL